MKSELSETIFANSTLPSKSTGTWGCNELDGDTKYVRGDRHEELREALREIVEADQMGFAEESGYGICAFCERLDHAGHAVDCPIAKAERLLQGVSEDG